MWKERAQHKHLDWVMFTLLYRIVVLNPLRHPDKVVLICYLYLDRAQEDLKKGKPTNGDKNTVYACAQLRFVWYETKKKAPEIYFSTHELILIWIYYDIFNNFFPFIY